MNDITEEEVKSALEAVEKDQVQNFLSDYNDIIVLKEDSGYGGKQVRIIHSATLTDEDLKANKNCKIEEVKK